MMQFIQADATRLPFADDAFDFVMGSPPSCGREATSSVIHGCPVDAEFVQRSHSFIDGVLSLNELRGRNESFPCSLERCQLKHKAFGDFGNFYSSVTTRLGAKKRPERDSLGNRIAGLISKQASAFRCCYEFFVHPIGMLFGVPKRQLAITFAVTHCVDVDDGLSLLGFNLQVRQQCRCDCGSCFVAHLPLEQGAGIGGSGFGLVNESAKHLFEKIGDNLGYLAELYARGINRIPAILLIPLALC
jgi:hypothetical protein